MRMLVIGVLVGAASTMVAALQQQTQYPGQMTDARVWVENRGPAQAVPVDVRAVNLDTPVRVQVVNSDSQYAPNPVQVRLVRQVWEYETIVLPAGDNPATVLARSGGAGWETTGITFAAPGGGTTVLLKRPR